tara:strand:+ start:1865 stop:2500 length:636 start_codon:yes stop_codon:yes gene_type:complete
MNVPKSALIFTIDQLKVKHHKEMEKMKKELLEEKGKVKELEDKFGVTQKRRWGIRQRKWWLIWLSNNDTDAYEYLMKTIHKTLLYGEGFSLGKGKQGKLTQFKRDLNHVHMSEKKFRDEDVNIYGMILNSANHWWIQGDPVISQLQRQTKDYLVFCCDENGIKYKKSWSKKMFIGLLLTYKPEKTYEKMYPMDLSIEELKELIELKKSETC